MRSIKRKLLSLVLAMAMVLSLAPTALAADTWSGTISAGSPKAGTATTLTLSNLTLSNSDTDSNNGNYTATSTAWSVTASPSGVSQNPTVSSDGAVTFPAAGQYTVQAKGSAKKTDNESTTGTYTVTGQITVAAADSPYVTAVNITPASVELTLGSNNISQVLSATVTMSTGTDTQGVTWSIKSGADYITWAEATKTVTAKAAGTAVITATAVAKGQNGTTVSKDVSIVVKSAATGSATLATNASTISVGGTATLTVTPTNLTPGTDYDYVKWNVTQTGAYVSLNSTTTGANANTNTVSGLAAGTATITASLMRNNVATAVYATNPVSVTVGGVAIIADDNNTSTIGYRGYLTLGVSGLPANTTYTYAWTVSTSPNITVNAPYLSNSTTATPVLYANGASSGTSIYVTVTATAAGGTKYTANRTFTANYSYQVTPTVTVYRSGNYNLNDPGVNNANSIVRQITNSIPGAYSYPYVMFTDNAVTGGSLTAKLNYPYYLSAVPTSYGYTGGLLSDIDFVPSAASSVTKAEFRFTLYYYSGINASTANTYTGIMTFNITGDAVNGDITYSASIGQDVNFDIRDFENYYYERTRGTLNYVTFTLPSGGYLYSDRTRLGVGNYCYASPRTNQIDLGGVYFTPTGTAATRAGSVSIPFTAYGTNGASRAGTVVITYLSGTAKDITYTALNNNAVALRPSDFTDAYRQVVGSTAPSGLTIQFQDVPANGTLTYTDSSRASSTAVTLRSGNIQSYKFNTLGSGANRLADVTYTASTNGRSDTISYIAYNGGTPQFTGKVVFNANSTANSMSVIVYSTGGNAVAFNYNAFVTANAVVMASCTSIRIVGMPNSGALTYNGAAVSAAGTDILPAALSQVVYRPNAGFNGTDKVTFVCYGANGSVAGSGQVNIIVSGNASSGGGASNISQFKDVKTDAWYATDLSALVSRGIMQGKGEGRFDPTGELKYGEALKIFLLSAGYSAQEGSGKNWAEGYKTLAVNNGWISSSIDLDAKISRNAMAELAARVLGISANSAVPPTWKDGTSNGYANALYYTNPQILVGNADGTFKGNTTLQRAEICKIAARVLNYKANQQSTQAPGWLS